MRNCEPLSGYPASRDDPVSALTECSVGIILHKDIERKFPNLGLVRYDDRGQHLQRMECRPTACARTHRTSALRANRSARTHRHRWRRHAVDQVDLADAVGLSTVHTSRTIQDLRPFGVLLKSSRAIAVAHWDRLVEIARFDGRYLCRKGCQNGAPPLKFITTLAICIKIYFE
jgi:hypothetical protein